MSEATVRNKTSRVIRAGSLLRADPDHPGGVAEAEAIGYAIEDVLAGATGRAWLELGSDGKQVVELLEVIEELLEVGERARAVLSRYRRNGL